MGPPDEKKTIEDVAREPEDRCLELLDGVMVEKASPDIGHSLAQAAITGLLQPAYGRKDSRGGGPGGWWVLPELDIALGKHDWVRPDVAGYRRDKHASIPKTRPLPLAPDWVCEVVSESNASRDTVQKVRLYHRGGVGHYWLVDPARRTLTVLRHQPDAYQLVLSATVGKRVRAEPFEAVELPVSELFEDTGWSLLEGFHSAAGRLERPRATGPPPAPRGLPQRRGVARRGTRARAEACAAPG